MTERQFRRRAGRHWIRARGRPIQPHGPGQGAAGVCGQASGCACARHLSRGRHSGDDRRRAPRPPSASLEAFAPVIEDASPGLGPLSGICAALSITSAHGTLYFYPSICLSFRPRSSSTFCAHARITGSAVTVPSVSGFTQTFPAVLDRAVLPALQSELDSQQQRLFFRVPGGRGSPGQPVSSVAVELLAQTGEVSDPLACRPSAGFSI